MQQSSDPLEALLAELDRARREIEVEAIAIAEASGCLVGGAGAHRQCEELAAGAPLAEPANDTGVLVRRISLDGGQLLLSCRGEPRAAARALALAADSARRWLGGKRRAG
jgi:hypothetical protein